MRAQIRSAHATTRPPTSSAVSPAGELWNHNAPSWTPGWSVRRIGRSVTIPATRTSRAAARTSHASLSVMATRPPIEHLRRASDVLLQVHRIGPVPTKWMDQMEWVVPPGDKPAFLRLAGAVVAGIEQGQLRPGDRLPGSRPLARRLGLHRNTVLAAWRELRAQGWIEATPGGSTRVAPLPDRVRPSRRAARPRPLFAVERPPPILLGPQWAPG